MRIFFVTCLLVFCTLFAEGRETLSFNEGWSFRKGPFPADPVLFFPVLSETWQEVGIPHTWNAVDMQTARNNYYAGETYYRKTFRPDARMEGKRLFLHFEGVASVAEVYVNRKQAGNHRGAYSAFAVEITDLLDYDRPNEILVKVDNAPRPEVIPINNTLFGVYGGIYRPVQLIVTEQVNIAVTDYASPGIYFSQRNVSHRSADLSIGIKVENRERETKTVRLISIVYENDGREKLRSESTVAVSPQGRHFFTQEMHLKAPHLWQGLEDPYLYRVVTQVVDKGQVIDEVTQPLGIRHFELKAGEGMYLNGKKVPMYGVCRHQDRWRLGSALTNREHEEDLALIREIGATTIRFAHYQQAEYIYARCDSIGFMVWAEIPFVNRVSTREGDNARQQLTELIRQNYNHPSIYIWGLHNEVYTPNNYTVALTRELHDLAKTEDPDRYTVSVSGYSQVDRPTNLHADVQGINHYFGWYGGRIGDVEPWIEGMERDFPGYRVIFSEYGAEANTSQQEEVVGDAGRYFSQFYPETFATRFHEIQWGVIAKHPYLLASYVWNMFDFATPATTQGGVEARNMKGLVTFDRKLKKDPFYWYKANWSREPVLYITQRRAVEREHEVTPVTVYSNLGKPKLFVNGIEHTETLEGTTPVHYIFTGVRLKAGENTVEARIVRNGVTYEDGIVWNYDPDRPETERNPQPRTRSGEHIGL